MYVRSIALAATCALLVLLSGATANAQSFPRLSNLGTSSVRSIATPPRPPSVSSISRPTDVPQILNAYRSYLSDLRIYYRSLLQNLLSGRNESRAACADSIDNDGDGRVDYPSDTGCTSASDTSEEGEVLATSASVHNVFIPDQTIVPGQSGFRVAEITFDAQASEEDIRFDSINLHYTDEINPDPRFCGAYRGSALLNTARVNPTETGEATFTFDSPLIVAAGATTSVVVRCDIPYDAAGAFRLGVAAQGGEATFSGVGVESGRAVTPTAPSTYPGPRFMIGVGTLSVRLDASSPTYAVAAAGTNGVILSRLRFDAANEDLELRTIALQLTGQESSWANLQQVTIWDGDAQVGNAIFAGARYATSTLVSPVLIPANSSTVLTLKGDLARIGTGEATTSSGYLMRVDYDGDDRTGTSAFAPSSGIIHPATSSVDTSSHGVRVFRSFPHITQAATPGQLAEGFNEISTITVTADTHGPVQLHTLTLDVAASGTTFTDPRVTGPNGDVGTVSFDEGSGRLTVRFDSATNTTDRVIPAGATRTFTVGGTVGALSGPGTAHVRVTLLGDASHDMGRAAVVAALARIVWSPNSTTSPASTGSPDWASGYGLPGCFIGLGEDCAPIFKHE